MMSRHFLVAVLILWSNTNPTSQKGLKKRLDYLKLQMEELSLKTERVDKNIQIMKGEQGTINVMLYISYINNINMEKC